MSDHHSKPRHHRRHRHRSRDQSVVEEIATGVGTTLAVALKAASQVVNHSLRKTDDIVEGIILSNRSTNSPHSQIHQQQQLYPQQQPYRPQQHYPPQQPYQQQHRPQQLYPKQQYYQPQRPYEPVYQHEESNTFLYQGHNSLITNVSQTSNTSGSTPVYAEPPPAYDEISPGYGGPHRSHLPPPSYSESLPARGALTIENAVDVLSFDGLPPPAYVKSPSVLVGTPSSTSVTPSTGTIVSSAPIAESTALPCYTELSQVYVGANGNRSSSSDDKAIPAYGYPPCYHYKYTDGCNYCLKWKWSS